MSLSRASRRRGLAPLAFALAFGLALASAAAPLRAFEFFEPVAPPRAFQVMAHRGMMRQAPENTAPALVRCIEDGIEWGEIDVRLTKDGRHVLSHDAKLEGKTNGAGLVSDLTEAEFLALDAGAGFSRKFSGRAAGEHPLSLAQAFELAKGNLNLYLDCKEINPEQLAKDILDAGMETQCVAYDDPAALKRVRAASGGRVAIMTKWRPSMGLDAWIEDLKPDAVEIDADQLTAEAAAAFHAKGVKVQIKVLGREWDKPEVWDRVLAMGADWLQTDRPEEIIAHRVWGMLNPRPVRMSLHRGANRYAPENTMPAFEKAIALGTDFVEFDVRTTQDGKFFLLHDGTLNRTTNAKGPIRAETSEAVAALDAGSWFGRPFAGVHPPSLDEFLTGVEGKVELYFDAKDIEPEALAEAVARHGMAEKTVVYQSADYLLKLKQIDPRIRALPPLDSADEIDALADKLQPYAVDAEWKILSKETIDHCHARGIKVFSDALGLHEKIEDYQQAINWGIDLIQTDRPLRVMRAVETLK